MKLKLFARLAEVAGTGQLTLPSLEDTDGLLQYLADHHPDLQSSSCMIALGNDLIHSNTPLTEDSQVALLPPFSGG